MTDDNIRIKANMGFNHFGVDLLISSRTHIAQITYVPYEEGSILNPTLSLDRESAQMLMDSLWRCGIRPSDGEGSVGQIGAIKDHLEDMRKIAFNELEINRDKL